MKTALLTAVGSASAGMVIERLHALGLRVVGCDIYPRAWNVASGEVDVFFQAVYATDADAYVRQMEEAVRREHADFLIPLTDVEVDALCAHKARFSALGCVLCVPDEPCARLCRDKQAMAALLAREGACRVIPTRSPYGWEPEAADYPLMLKPLHGRSSQGQVIARTPQAYHAALDARGDYIAQPYLDGDIYTVDVARDRFGHVQALARHELLRTPNGLGTAVRVLPGHPLEAVCAGGGLCGRGGRGEHGIHRKRQRCLVSGGQSPFFGRRGLQRAGRRGFSRAQPALPCRGGYRFPCSGSGDDAGTQVQPGHHGNLTGPPGDRQPEDARLCSAPDAGSFSPTHFAVPLIRTVGRCIRQPIPALRADSAHSAGIGAGGALRISRRPHMPPDSGFTRSVPVLQNA